MTRPLNVKGWFRLKHISGVESSLPKVVYIDDWNSKMARILLEQRYQFLPVHVVTDRELRDLVREGVELEMGRFENKDLSSSE